MEFEEESVSTLKIKNLYNENKMLGSTLRNTVSKFEEKKIQQMNKRNRYQVLLNMKFEEISKIRKKLEQIANSLDRSKSDCAKELLKREDIEQKNILNERAFKTQLDFQRAVSEKLYQCIEEINNFVLNNGQNTRLIEETWEFFQDTVYKYKKDRTYLQTKINEIKNNSRLEALNLDDEIELSIQNIINYKKILENLIEKSADIESCIKKLPFDECKMRIEEGTASVANMQKKLHHLKTEIVLKIEEIKRKKDKEEFELKHLLGELSFAKEQYTDILSETQKISEIIKSLKVKIEGLSKQINEHIEHLKSVKDTKAIKDEEEKTIANEVNKLSGVELMNEGLKNGIEIIIKEIEESNFKLNEVIDHEKEIKEKDESLLRELELRTEKLEILKEENNNLEDAIEQLQTDSKNCVVMQNDSEKSLSDEIGQLLMEVEKLEENLSQLKTENNVILNDKEKFKEESRELKNIFDERLKEEAETRQKVVDLTDQLETYKADRRSKLQSKEEDLNCIEIVIAGCDQVINGDLLHVPEEYERLLAVKDSMLQKFILEKESMIKNHTDMLKKIDSELTCMQNMADESLGIEMRRGDTIREEIKKQNEKNIKLEGKCQQYEDKIKIMEHKIEEMKNRIVTRENKLRRASREAVVTQKELLDCIKGTESLK